MGNWMNKHIWTCFFLVYFGYHLTLPILGEKLSVPPHFQVVNVSSLQPKPYCQKSTSGATIGSQKLELVSRYGPCYPNGKTPTSGQLLNWDEDRVDRMNRRPEQPLPSILNGRGYYTVNVGIGTPRQNFNLMVDTGSLPTWVRCKPCTSGCKSEDSLFDSSKSSTYTNNTTSCSGPFSVSYGDKSSSKGTWGCDTLTGVEDVDAFIKNFRFGCGEEIGGDDFGDAAGILGLGRGESSLTTRIPSAVQKFSYYIPTTSSRKGDLLFGNKAKTKSDTCANVLYTPLVKGQNPVYYYVDLVGISVAGKKLQVPSTTFTSGGTVIDSGTIITRLPGEVYSALRAAFRRSMLKYTLLSEKVDDLLDTCYSLKGNEKQLVLPDITFHFGKGTAVVDMTLSAEGKLWTPHASKGTITCLAFAAAKELTIIGNVQQRGLNVIYDLEGERIGFGTNCAAP
ncbi:hypothetical protein HAX54_039367 [Datura stramonium]|uniref:Peptidase A1 domain-containing protein n=1 Tax=Datura stramonium TaxID=4076 RepID=A0ABS8VP11_DATST|nr:hypothetical protein [Datura stramonium]